MSFEQEWAQHQANAAARRAGSTGGTSPSTRLNQATTGDADGSSGSGWLLVKDDELGKVGHAAYRLFEGLRKNADLAADGSGSGGEASITRAAQHLSAHSFLLGKALGRTAKVWESQLKTVLQGCAHISNHLDYSKGSFTTEDRKIGAQMRGVAGALPPSAISRLLD